MEKKAKTIPRLHASLLWLEEALHGSLLTSIDILRTMSMVWKLQNPNAACPLSWEIVDSQGGAIHLPGIQPSEASRDVNAHTLLIVPALHVYNSYEIGRIVKANSPALLLIEKHVKADGWVTATHGGIEFLATLGLLDGAKVSVPWGHHAWFTRVHPQIDFSASASIVMHKKIFLSPAPSLQAELMLSALERLVDANLAQAAANLLTFRMDRQSIIADITNSKSTGVTSDSPVFRAIQWLQAHIEEPYSLAALVDVSAASERTLLRHFHEVTGMSPLDYLHRLRVERAKVLLEVTIRSVEVISRACGYTDVSSFRRLFHSLTGMTPNTYRSYFSLRAPRSHWRVEGLE
jgi:transcriptional regulator GlxA family with amidase domain